MEVSRVHLKFKWKRKVSNFILDKDIVCFIQKYIKLQQAAAPALSRAKEAAKKNGSPYGITISTTPNDRDSAEGAYAYSILDSAVRFDDTWYDKTPKEILNIIKNQSKNDFVYIKYHYYQLGRDEEWLKEQSRNLNNDLLKIKRELLLEWTLTNDRSPFSEEQLNTVQAYIKDEPIKNLYIGEYKFKVYEELTNMTEKNWLMAIDIGGGLSLDFTVISIIDPMNYKLKAIFRTNCIDAVELVKLVRTMLCTFFPEAVVIPERTGIGQGIVQMMMKDPVISRRLYYEVKDKIVEKKVEDVRVNGTFVKKKSKVKVYGQDTTASSRNVMFNEILSYIINESPESIICPELFDEMKTLERSTNRGNRIEAKQGAHDDVVMSYLIGLYALFRGSNIKKFVSLQGDYSEDDPLAVSPREERQKRIKRNMANLYYDVNNFSPGIQELIKQQNIILEDEKPEKEKKNYLSKVRKLLEQE